MQPLDGLSMAEDQAATLAVVSFFNAALGDVLHP